MRKQETVNFIELEGLKFEWGFHTTIEEEQVLIYLESE